MKHYELNETHVKQLGILQHYGNYHRFVIVGIRLSTLLKMSFAGKPIMAQEFKSGGCWHVQFFMIVGQK